MLIYSSFWHCSHSWPLEVYGHDGVATNVTMEPGEMVLYESHSVIHGRPFPLRGNFYANCFVHFEPIAPIDGSSKYDPTIDLPPYLIPGSAWETEWRKENKGWKKVRKRRDALVFFKSKLFGFLIDCSKRFTHIHILLFELNEPKRNSRVRTTQ